MATVTAGALYPVSSSGTFPNANFTTNPAYSGTFIPTVWSGKLNAKFYSATTFGDIANTNWQGDIGNMGDKVIINNIPTLNVSDYTAGTALTYQVPTPDTIELSIDKGKYFAFQVNDVLEYQAKPNLMEMFSTDAGNQLKIKVDTDCWLGVFNQAAAANVGATAGALSGAYNMGTDAAPVSLTSGNILSFITSMATILDEQNIPETDRWLVITPAERQLLMNSNLAQAQFMGDSESALRNGRIGRIDRFTVYLSNLLPRAALDQNYTGGADAGKPKRHTILAGHKSAFTFASQINKVETVRNPNDFGDFIRGLMVYGRKAVKTEAFTTGIIAG
jgi:hypothetical protein